MNNFDLKIFKKSNFLLILISLSFSILCSIVLIGIIYTLVFISVITIAIIIFLHPVLGLYLLIFIEPLSFFVVTENAGNLGKFFGLYLIIIVLLRNNLILKNKSIKIDKNLWLFFVLSFYCMFSLLYAVDKNLSLTFIFRLLRYTGIYFLFVNLVNSEKKYFVCIYAFLIGNFTVMIIGFYNFFYYNFVRMTALSYNPNSFGINMGLSFFFLFYVILKKANNIFIKIALFFILLLFIFAAFISQSRGVWVSLITSFCLLAFLYILENNFNLINVSKFIVISIFIITFVFLSFNMLKESNSILFARVKSLSILEDIFGVRLQIWTQGYEVWIKNPIFGIGVNNYSIFTNRDPHSVYMANLVELGLIGTIIWFIIYFSFFKIAISNKHRLLLLPIFIFLIIVSIKGTYHDNQIYWHILGFIGASKI